MTTKKFRKCCCSFDSITTTDCYSINGILSDELVQCKTLHSVVWNVIFTVIRQMSLTWSLAASARQLINQSLVVISSQFRHLLSSQLIVRLLRLPCND